MGPDALGPYALTLRKRGLLAACLALVIISLFVIYTERAPFRVSEALPAQFTPSHDVVPDPDPLGPKLTLRGPPTASFRGIIHADNLLPEKQFKYITSWLSAGWTNDVYTYINLIYLGLITDRVPIIPMFIPSHVGGSVPPIPFGEVFDVPRLRNELGKPVLEWRDVKDQNSTELDDIGCWNVWESVQYREAFPRRSRIPDDLRLDISYTKTPSWIKMIPNYEHDQHVTFWSLATLAFPTTRAASLVSSTTVTETQLYYVSAHQPFEMEYDYRHERLLSFSVPSNLPPALLGDTKALGVVENAQIPPFISLHIRRLDFQVWCNGLPIDECFASLRVIARRVREVQEEVRERTGVTVPHVLVTSDERNATFWDDVAKLGWFAPDHSETKKRYGDWYPVLLDAVIQSRGAGFVGTDRSTMSIIAARRVGDWNHGPHRLVKWGSKGADDH
ncbi:hypothetical protein C8F01DRAFT_1244580 [Mycena amicta]|nr:hypothetical protein C8F01DRAFT_1244580 [Mycena amicta]